MNKCKYCNSTIPPDDLCARCVSILDGWYEQIAEDNNWEENKKFYDPDKPGKEAKSDD
jgi:hypothetical protein